MGRPLFVAGMQRSGTSILTRIVQTVRSVARQFHPCPRYDIPFLAELGAGLPPKQSLWLQEVGRYFARTPEPWGLVHLALAVSAESFAWPLLAERFPKAAFVFTLRDSLDAQASWRDSLPYLAAYEAQKKVSPAAYFEWSDAQRDLIETFAAARPDRSVVISYEELVLAPKLTMAPVWRLLKMEAPKGWEKWIRKPKHWNLPRRKALT
ncbi:unnamed protein product [marine sediment metagenome]|uniref:Sulfotransferase domain-containing protein n=1 Tax=marine sediment metagenome TaxID=412755 RepID=X1EEQ0_9ZZZZ